MSTDCVSITHSLNTHCAASENQGPCDAFTNELKSLPTREGQTRHPKSKWWESGEQRNPIPSVGRISCAVLTFLLVTYSY